MDVPISSKYRSTPDEPVSDGERSQLSEQLNEAFASGRIDQATYSNLLDKVFGAQRLGDLVEVVEVLGKPATYAVPAVVAEVGSGRPGELAETRSRAPRSLVVLASGIAAGVVVAVIVILVLLLVA